MDVKKLRRWLDFYRIRVGREVDRKLTRWCPTPTDETHINQALTFLHTAQFQLSSRPTVGPAVERETLVLAVLGQIMRQVRFPHDWSIEHKLLYLLQRYRAMRLTEALTSRG